MKFMAFSERSLLLRSTDRISQSIDRSGGLVTPERWKDNSEPPQFSLTLAHLCTETTPSRILGYRQNTIPKIPRRQFHVCDMAFASFIQ